MNEAQTRTACLLLGEPRAEMRGNAGWAEAIVQNRLDDDVVALDVVIDGEREVRNHHAVMPEVDRVYACEINEGIERGVDVLHEVVKYPCAVGGIEVLSLGEVELGKSRESHAFHVTARSDGPLGGLSRPTSRKPESPFRRRVCTRSRFKRRPKVVHHLNFLRDVHLIDLLHYSWHVPSLRSRLL